MGQEAFSIREIWRSAFRDVKRNLVFLLTAMLIFSLPLDFLHYSQRAYLERGSGFFDLATFISFFLIAIVNTVFIKIGLCLSATKKASFADLPDALHSYWRYLLGYFLYILIFAGGLLLLIVPGIIWAVKYKFFGYFIVDQGMKPVEAIKRSGLLAKGRKGKIFVFDLIFVIVWSLLFWPLWLLSKTASQIVASMLLPLFLIVLAYAYRGLLASESEHPEADQAE